MLKVVSLLVSCVFVVHHSFAYSSNWKNLVQEQVHALEKFELEDENVHLYQDLLMSFINEIQREESLIDLNDDQQETRKIVKNYKESLYALNKISHSPKSSLEKIKKSQEVFVSKYKDLQEKSFLETIYNFITSPVGLTVALLATVGLLWFYWDPLKKLFSYEEPSENLSKSLSSTDLEGQEYSDSIEIADTDEDDVQSWSMEKIKSYLAKNQIYHILNGRDSRGDSALMWLVIYLIAKDTSDISLIKDVVNLKQISKDHLNLLGSDGHTPLTWAAYSGRLDIVKTLAKKMNAQDLNKINSFGVTALMTATVEGHKKIVGFLLVRMNFSDIHLRDSKGNTPFLLAAQKGHHSVIGLLLPKLTKKDFQTVNKKGETALLVASKKGFNDVVKPLLNYRHMSSHMMELVDEEGFTPLMWAVDFGNTETVKILLDHSSLTKKALLHKNKYGHSPLSWAIKKRNFKIIRLLKLKHMEMIEKGPLGRSSWTKKIILKAIKEHKVYTILNKYDGNWYTPLTWAFANNHISIVRELLLNDFISKKNIQRIGNNGQTVLTWSAYNGYLDFVKRVLEPQFIDKNFLHYQDRNNDTALCLAVWKGHVDVVKEILANINMTIDGMKKKCHRGFSALKWASKYEKIPRYKIISTMISRKIRELTN